MKRTIKAFKIPCNGQPPELVEIPDELEVYQEFVGGYIEIVRVHPDAIMVVNDTGLIDGLPINLLASTLYPGPTPICGNVWLVGDHHDEDFHDVPQRFIDTFGKLDKVII